MGWLIDVLLFGVGWLVGTLLMSFSTCQLLITVKCAFPILNKIRNRNDLFDVKTIQNVFTFTLVLHTVLSIAGIALVMFFASSMLKWGFFVGYGIALLGSVGKCGMTEANISDTVRILSNHVRPGKNQEAFMYTVHTIGIV